MRGREPPGAFPVAQGDTASPQRRTHGRRVSARGAARSKQRFALSWFGGRGEQQLLLEVLIAAFLPRNLIQLHRKEHVLDTVGANLSPTTAPDANLATVHLGQTARTHSVQLHALIKFDAAAQEGAARREQRQHSVVTPGRTVTAALEVVPVWR